METVPVTLMLDIDHRILADAVRYACEKHCGQVRKGTTVPYVSHLLAVAALVLEHGGSLTQAAAGVLHDVVEDTGVSLDEVRTMFGDEIAAIVEACTDTVPLADGSAGTGAAKAPWRERKEAHLRKLAGVSPAAALVIACDKLHNLQTQVNDLHWRGQTVQFNASRDDRAWLHGATLAALRPHLPDRLARELSAVTSEWIVLEFGV